MLFVMKDVWGKKRGRGGREFRVEGKREEESRRRGKCHRRAARLGRAAEVAARRPMSAQPRKASLFSNVSHRNDITVCAEGFVDSGIFKRYLANVP